jgi:hypothetical protein
MKRWIVSASRAVAKRIVGVIKASPDSRTVVFRKYLYTSKLSFSEFVIFLAFGGNSKKLWNKIGHNFFGESKTHKLSACLAENPGWLTTEIGILRAKRA